MMTMIKLVLFSLLAVSIWGLGIEQVYAETVTETFDTEQYGIYILDFQYSSSNESGMMDVFWNGQNIYPNAQTIPDTKSFYVEVATDKENTELILDFEDTIIDNITLEYQGQMSELQIKANFPGIIEDPKDKRITELETRVQILEDEKFNLEKENSRLNGIIETLQNEAERLTDDFYNTILNQMEWFRSQN